MKLCFVFFVLVVTVTSALPPGLLIDSLVKSVTGTGKGIVGKAVNTSKDAIDGAIGTADKATDFLRPDDVCYDGLECFTMDAPWWTVLRPLPAPSSPKDIEPRFYLYTRNQPKRYNLSTSDIDFDASGSMFDGDKDTFFITHGFASNGNSSWLNDMKDALIQKFDCNVILVDWGKGASSLNYFQVASNTRVVAAVTAKLVKYLINQWGADPSRITLIGHSLGAQISSYIAKRVPNVARVFALDPAQPAFEGYNKLVRLDKSDAEFIEVIHTSSRPFIPFIGLGMIQSYGHIDFYMNGGWDQPGCILPANPPNITSFLDLATVPVEVISNFISCPHGRSYEFLTASIVNDNCTFWGHMASYLDKAKDALSLGILSQVNIVEKMCKTDTCSPLGFDAQKYPARGSFHIATTRNEPFCIVEEEIDAKMRQFKRAVME